MSSLYLDYYPPILHPETGKLTRWEMLKLTTYTDPKSTEEKNYNKQMFALGEAARSQRQLEVSRDQFGFLRKTSTIDFINYMEGLIAKRHGSNRLNWDSALKWLKLYVGNHMPMSKINPSFCDGFKDFLLNETNPKRKGRKLAHNSSVSYFIKFKTALKQAYKDDLLTVDVAARVKPIPYQETEREHLSLEELQAAVLVPCDDPIFKQAALFSALTGLRFSDIFKLMWKEVRYTEAEGYYLQFRQLKTKGVETHPISKEAFDLLGERKADNEKVFTGLKYSAHKNKLFRDWLKKAGITRHFTFHCMRHTYSCLQLEAGTDLYTLKDLLGHLSVQSTQIYGKVVHRNKREAASKIKLTPERNDEAR
jgi:integrase